MRELLIEECFRVGGGYQDSSYQDSTDTGGGSGGTGGGATGGGTTTPPTWSHVVSQLETFLDQMDLASSGYATQGGSTQNSDYDDYSDSAPWDPGFVQDMMVDWGFLPETITNDPGFHFWDYLTQDIDPEFLVASSGGSSFKFATPTDMMTIYDSSQSNSTLFNVSGTYVVGEFHPGSPTTTDPDGTIVVHGGDYWTFTFAGFGPDSGSYMAPPPSDYTVASSSTGEPSGPFVHSTAAHMAAGASRYLTEAEKVEIDSFLHLTQAQLDAVVITNGGQMSGAAATTWNAKTIDFDSTYALVDYSGSKETMGLLIHEMEHVYQWNNTDNIATFIGDEIAGQFRDIYAYKQADLANFANLNVETRAQIVEDWYRENFGLTPLGATGFSPSVGDLMHAVQTGQP